MNCAYLAFTAKGLALAQQLAQTCPGSVSRCGLGGVTLAGWTAQQFAAADALVFVGAAGIAVRAIAPTAKARPPTPPLWCWMNAAALRCRCSPAIWAAQMTWPAGWLPPVVRCR